MSCDRGSLDAYAKPPESLRTVFKKYQHMKTEELDADEDILDFAKKAVGQQEKAFRSDIAYENSYLSTVLDPFVGRSVHGAHDDLRRYESVDVPGLTIIPFCLPLEVQSILLSRLLHRDLSNPAHKTNVHFHHDVPYPPPSTSFFSFPPSSDLAFPPLSNEHKPFSLPAFLNKKLRWVTLGGQYDWTLKRYPTESPPEFPKDVGGLVEGLFPEMKAQAAIVNFYSPGDTLSMHRDVSEECDRGLVSVSLGCDGLFVIGFDAEGEGLKGTKHVVVRLRSGDAVYMEGKARFAWHGVPKVIAGTCPEALKNWPACNVPSESEVSSHEHWKGWLENKRINLNVRQMRD
ncbi:oxidoreductase [Rhizodiscina lignyota]|uniref:mRNA N(6)-methyladenine demethylase n=1 Tax=Rhizodiscina lignyota TaxID=1504668 RepID=A0A9P4IBL1_9PEZI|nr:oxidoreductase [Rhizodiscina lignyota]